MKNKLHEITKKYLNDTSMASFARQLGLQKASRQLVFNWITYKSAPSEWTAWKVSQSPDATEKAKAWAQEVLSVYAEQDNH